MSGDAAPSQQARTRTLSGAAWAVAEYAGPPFLLLAMTPFFLRNLGTSNYGHWMLLNATVGLGAILNTGTGPAVIKHVAAAKGEDRARAFRDTVHGGLTIALAGGAIMAVLIVGFFLTAGPSVFAKMGNPRLLVTTGIFAAALAWIEQLDNVFASALKGVERFGSAARLELLSKTVQVATAALTVLAGLGILAVYISMLAASMFRLVLKSRAVRTHLNVQTLIPSRSSIKGILHYAAWGWVQGLGGLLWSTADRMIVGSYLGATSLAHYAVISQLAQQVHALPAASFSVIFPMLSRRLASTEGLPVSGVIGRAFAVEAGIAASLALGLVAFGPLIMFHWIGPISGGRPVLYAITAAYFVLALNVVPHYFLLAGGKIRFLAIINVLAGILQTITLLLLIDRNGLVGVGVSRVVYGVVALSSLLPVYQQIRRSK